MLKFSFSSLLFIFLGPFLYSQCICVELAIKWDNEIYIFPEDSITCVPKLCITYRNNTNIDYYFHKFSNSSDEYPGFVSGMMFQYPYDEYINPDYWKRVKTQFNYTGEEFRVLIGYSPSYNEPWYVVKENGILSDSNTMHMINQDLFDIYNYLKWKQMNNILPVIKIGFSNSDLNEETILKTIDEFIFLRKGEVHTDTFNLVGFDMVKGTFTFRLNPKNLINYVFTESKEDGFISIETKLPNHVGGYQLYIGDYHSNQVSVTFK